MKKFIAKIVLVLSCAGILYGLYCFVIAGLSLYNPAMSVDFEGVSNGAGIIMAVSIITFGYCVDYLNQHREQKNEQ